MTFLRSMVLVGEGRLTGAVSRNGQIDFFIDTDGAVIKKSMQSGRRGVKGGQIVSYADEYTETGRGAFFLFGSVPEGKPLA